MYEQIEQDEQLDMDYPFLDKEMLSAVPQEVKIREVFRAITEWDGKERKELRIVIEGKTIPMCQMSIYKNNQNRIMLKHGQKPINWVGGIISLRKVEQVGKDNKVKTVVEVL